MNQIVQKLTELGYNTIDATWYDRVATWDSWYKGNVEKFHVFKVCRVVRALRMARLNRENGGVIQ